jgi:hypothetical protein
MKGSRRFFNLVLELLRELGDQNAYQRYLAYHHRVHSREEWRRFQEARLDTKYRGSRCC